VVQHHDFLASILNPAHWVDSRPGLPDSWGSGVDIHALLTSALDIHQSPASAHGIYWIGGPVSCIQKSLSPTVTGVQVSLQIAYVHTIKLIWWLICAEETEVILVSGAVGPPPFPDPRVLVWGINCEEPKLASNQQVSQNEGKYLENLLKHSGIEHNLF
jgi:hypothetical protein